jgi:SAM-dependent methyltransferase
MREARSERTEAASRCRVCGSAARRDFFAFERIPVQDGQLYATRSLALDAPVGDIRLAFCPSCGHIDNRTFEPEKLRYDGEYEASLHHSPLYAQFLRDLALRLTATYGLRGRTILEIACGNGDFLRLLARAASARGVGFDPSFRVSQADTDGGRLEFVADYYSERYSDRTADFVCCRHLLQSLPEPRPLVRSLSRTLGDRPVPVYFEVPNALRMFRDEVLWYVIYEYCSFFTPASFARLFESEGFEVLGLSECFGGDYLGIEVRPAAGGGAARDRRAEVDAVAEDVARFTRAADETLARWRSRMEELRRSGRRVAAWGAGGRAITFLSQLRVGDEIPFVADINPNRQGRYLPGTGQRVVPPEFLREYRPDVVIVTNPTFDAEIREQARSLGVTSQFLTL